VPIALKSSRIEKRLRPQERHRTHPVQDGRRHGLEQSCHHQELAGMTRDISKDFTAAQNVTMLVGRRRKRSL
jgi:hypothetical protein